MISPCIAGTVSRRHVACRCDCTGVGVEGVGVEVEVEVEGMGGRVECRHERVVEVVVEVEEEEGAAPLRG